MPQSATLEAQSCAIRELSTVVAQSAAGGPIDVDALANRIESAIESISVRLEVEPLNGNGS